MITKLIEGLPNQSMQQNDFDAAMGKLMTDLPAWAGEVNATAAALNSVAAGGGFAFPYTFSTTITDADPGAGVLRLNNATQSIATVMRVDLSTALGADVTAALASFVDSTSNTKGQLRLVKLGDPTKWIAFHLISMASPAGYKNFAVVVAAASGASPFADGDALALQFARTGDKGDVASNTAFTPQALAGTDIDCSLGFNYFTKTIGGNTTLTFSNVPTGFSFTLELKHDSGTLTLPTTVKPPSDVMPALLTGKTHLLMFVTSNGGARWRVTAATNYTT